MTDTFATPDIAIERRDDGTTILCSRHAAPDPEPSITAVLRTRAAEHPDRPLAAQRDRRRSLDHAHLRGGQATQRRARPHVHRAGARPGEAGHDPVGQLARAPAGQPRRLRRPRAGDADQRRLFADERRPRPDPGDRGADRARAGVRRRRRTVRAGARRPGGAGPDRPRRHGRPRRLAAPEPGRRPRRQPARWRPRSGRDRQTPIHIRIDRHPEGGHQHPPDAVFEPGDDRDRVAVSRRGAAGARRLAPVEPHVRRQPQPEPGAVQRRHDLHRRRPPRAAAVPANAGGAERRPADAVLQRPGRVRAARPRARARRGSGPAVLLPPEVHVLCRGRATGDFGRAPAGAGERACRP